MTTCTSSGKMDVVSAVSGYISKMASAGDTATGSSSAKMKILLLDSETVRVCIYLCAGWAAHTSLGLYCVNCYNAICASQP